MSPEQGLADKNLDGRSDQYALACVLYEMLAGQAPFQGSSMMQLVMRHALEPVPPLRIQRQTVSEDLEAVILRALAKAPADRWPSLKEFAQALVQPTGVTWAWRTATTVGMAAAAPARSRRRRPLIVAGLAALLVAAGSAVAWQQMTAASTVNTAAGGLDARRIAITYFDDASSGHSLGYLADGLTESLIDALDRVDLDVVSAGGVAPFRNSTIARDSIARTLRWARSCRAAWTRRAIACA
jgi:serine/threonine-protein kinase